MAAGMNIRVKVWRMSTTSSDDRVGGAIITGTNVYNIVMARIDEVPAQMVLVQQGLETLTIFRMTIMPGTLTIYERDEVEVVQPRDHYFYGDRFRVKGVTIPSHNPRDPRNYMTLLLTRSERMHSLQ